jgi:thymidine kinase
MSKAEAHLTVGPMCSGKSTRLISTVMRYRSVGVPVLVIKPVIDSRSDDVATHALGGARTACIRINRWDELWRHPDYAESQIVCIDEAQFFGSGMTGALSRMLCDDKKVYMYGLDGSAEQKPMWPLHEIIPMCDTVEKLQAMCHCGGLAPFTMCDAPLPDDGVLIQVTDGSFNYMPMCRGCLRAWKASD